MLTFASEIETNRFSTLKGRGCKRPSLSPSKGRGFLESMAQSVKNTLKAVMNLAWKFVKENGMKMSLALRKAWANIKLQKDLHKDIVCFRYIKLSTGELRTAYGTLSSRIVPPTNGTRREYSHLQTYYDTVKKGWRCFAKSELVID